ncbi:hypothetical protein J6590_038168 [Homalodisca vitripennis]|nr:hypothetical protein J6590_038168 [Homalodisca vitripennis]
MPTNTQRSASAFSSLAAARHRRRVPRTSTSRLHCRPTPSHRLLPRHHRRLPRTSTSRLHFRLTPSHRLLPRHRRRLPRPSTTRLYCPRPHHTGYCLVTVGVCPDLAPPDCTAARPHHTGCCLVTVGWEVNNAVAEPHPASARPYQASLTKNVLPLERSGARLTEREQGKAKKERYHREIMSSGRKTLVARHGTGVRTRPKNHERGGHWSWSS